MVNCAGALQDSLRDSLGRVHRDAPAALWRACEEAGVRRVVQVSAIGVDRGGATTFSRSKQAGDAALEQSGLDWVILRPSVVVGRAAYGGSALFRALAALPVLPRIPDAGLVDVVQLDDVAETVAVMLRPDAPARVALELAGPERLAFPQIVAAYRNWLGWPPARGIRVPAFLLAIAWRLDDLAAWFGWRPPLRSTARRELVRGAIGDPEAWTRLTGIAPRALGEALAAEPASVQERWFARLYLLKPLASWSSPASGWSPASSRSAPAATRRSGLMQQTAAADWAGPLVVGGAWFDVLMGVALAVPAHRQAGTAHRLLRDDPLSGGRDDADAVALDRPARAADEDLAGPRAQSAMPRPSGRPMTTYYLLKFLHVIGATVLLGTGAGIAFFMLMAHRTGDAATIAATGADRRHRRLAVHRHRGRRPAGHRPAARPPRRLRARPKAGSSPRSRSIS